MSKNKKMAPKSAPQTENVTAEATVNLQDVARNTTKGNSSMSRDNQATLIGVLHDRFYKDPNAKEHTGLPEETIKTINEVNAIAAAVVMCQEVAFGNSDMALILRKSEFSKIKEIAPIIGFNIDGTKLLTSPASTPTEEDTVTVPVDAVTVSDSLKKELEEDNKTQKNAMGISFDPTKIDDNGFKAALGYFMTTHQGEMIMYNLNRAVAFYRSYMQIKHKDDATKLEEIKNMPASAVFQEIVKLTGRVGILASGIGNYAFIVTTQTGSPISAFCSLRNSSIDRTTKEQKYTDTEIAEMTKMLVIMRANMIIAENTVDKPTDKQTKNIEYAQHAIECVTCPSGDFVANITETYKSGSGKDHMLVKKVIKSIVDSYLGLTAEQLSTAKIDSLLNAVTQYAGTITNLFRDPSNQISGYSLTDADHIEYKTPEEIAEEKAAAEKAEAEAAEKKAQEDAKKAKTGKQKAQVKK